MHRSNNAARRGRFLLILLACATYGGHASGHDALVSVFDRVNPAVVVIYTVERQARPKKLVIDVLRGGQVERLDFYGFYKTAR